MRLWEPLTRAGGESGVAQLVWGRDAGVFNSIRRSSQLERSPVSALLGFNVALQTIAAFVIFVVGYAALFGTLSVCFAIAMGLYECAKRIWAYRARLALARREKRCVLPA